MYRFWIISLLESRVIYTRFWPHSEKRDGFFFPHVSQEEFLRILFSSLGINNPKNNVRNSNQSPLSKDRSLTNASELDYISMRSGMSGLGTGTTLNSSRGSSGSNDSLNSLMSTNTIASNASSMTRDKKEVLSSEFEDFDFISAPNFLPIITCRFVTKPRENQENRSLYIDLNLVVFEVRGYLFVASPQLSPSTHNSRNRATTFEELFLEEQNISLTYSTLQAISHQYFDSGRNLKSLEVFITENMPFGVLVNDLRTKNSENIFQKALKDQSESHKQPQFLIHLIVNEYLSSSLLNESETIFGTVDVIPNLTVLGQVPGTADLKISVENLERFTLARPFNCDISSSGLVFNLKRSKIPPFGLLHFRAESLSEYHSASNISNDSQSVMNRKLFSYRYTITKKNKDAASNNLYHLQLILTMNPKIICEDLKFQIFVIKFCLLKQQSKVQTATSSFVNLLVRESIKLSGGQVRNEANACTWTLTNMSKNGRFTLAFDVLLPDECVKLLETAVTFRLENHFQTRFKDDPREANLRYKTRKLQPEMMLSTATLVAGIGLKSQLPVLLDYKLQSFEYKLFPKWIDL